MLRWAILGTGFISGTVVEAIAGSDGSSVEIVAGRNQDRLDAFSADHGIERATTDFGAAVADAAVDAVYIGLPNHVHHDWVMAASAAGKAVLSEKSLTATMATADQLLDSVQNNGTFFVEGLMYLAHPLYRRVTELLTDGRLGTIRAVEGRYAADIWRVVNPEGMGTIYNLGCYPVSLLHLVIQTAFGAEAFDDRTIVGLGNRNAADGTVCDAAMTVRFGNGVLATMQSTDSYGNASHFAVLGDGGELRFETNPWLPVAGDNVIRWLPFGEAAGESETIVINDGHDAFHHQIKLVERCVAEGLNEAPRPSPRPMDSRQIMTMLTEWEALCLG